MTLVVPCSRGGELLGLDLLKLLHRQTALVKLVELLLPSLVFWIKSAKMKGSFAIFFGSGGPRNHTFCCSLCSEAASMTADTYSEKPSCSRAFVMWSHAMVFFASFSEISLASDETSVMNSTQHSISRSRASFAKATPLAGGRISVTIFWTVAVVACQHGAMQRERTNLGRQAGSAASMIRARGLS